MNSDELTPTRKSKSQSMNSRRGMAPLEMVLVLPFLMMLMAMIILFGFASTWKIRTESASRDSAWRVRYERFANAEARPTEWPEPATMSVRDTANIVAFESSAVLNDPIIAGPLAAIEVREELLEYGQGMYEGVSEIDRTPTIFSQLTRYKFFVDHPILDNRFQFSQMNIGNRTRRFPVIYATGMDNILDSTEIQNAVSMLESNPRDFMLKALDRDEEFIAWQGFAYDFHPRLRGFISTDRDWVETEVVGSFINAVERLPVVLGYASLNLYLDMKNMLNPPIPASTLMFRIGELRRWIAQKERKLANN